MVNIPRIYGDLGDGLLLFLPYFTHITGNGNLFFLATTDGMKKLMEC